MFGEGADVEILAGAIETRPNTKNKFDSAPGEGGVKLVMRDNWRTYVNCTDLFSR